MKIFKQIAKAKSHIIVMLMLFSVVGCKKLSSFDNPTSVVSTYEILFADDNYSYFRYVAQRANLNDMLKGDGAYTFFIPTNSAFLNGGYNSISKKSYC
jgi:uncharacterized surface protein with fasciclin (FAS1) repeats